MVLNTSFLSKETFAHTLAPIDRLRAVSQLLVLLLSRSCLLLECLPLP